MSLMSPPAPGAGEENRHCSWVTGQEAEGPSSSREARGTVQEAGDGHCMAPSGSDSGSVVTGGTKSWLDEVSFTAPATDSSPTTEASSGALCCTPVMLRPPDLWGKLTAAPCFSQRTVLADMTTTSRHLDGLRCSPPLCRRCTPSLQPEPPQTALLRPGSVFGFFHQHKGNLSGPSPQTWGFCAGLKEGLHFRNSKPTLSPGGGQQTRRC